MRFPRCAAALLFCLVIFADVGWSQTAVRLFFIARTKNANTVCYDARLTKDGRLDVQDPVHGYWTLWATDSTGNTREELNGMERRMAFGYSIRKCTPTSCAISLAALRSRIVEVTFHGTTPRAVTTIAGKPSYLKKIFVVSGDGFIVPRVSSATLYGTDTAGGAEVRETITPR